jgi:DNA repair protein RecN (Recombination protein N)
MVRNGQSSSRRPASSIFAVLRRLRIDNLVLIDCADLALSPGLVALTGETGAGKTILTQAIGLLLGAKGDAGTIGPRGEEAYVEAEFDVDEDFFAEEEVTPLTEMRPAGESGLVLARRVFADGRTRAYAWGRAVSRDDLAAAAERLIAMSGQFEQRRLARPAYQLDVLDAFIGPEQAVTRRAARSAWRELTAARRRYDALTRDVDAVRSRIAELEALVADTEGLEPGLDEKLRLERERYRRVADLGEAVAAALNALAPEDGNGASALASVAERTLAPLAHVAPELDIVARDLRDITLRLQETGSDLARFSSSLEVDPERSEEVEALLERIALARRRHRAESYEDLLERRDAAAAELDRLAGGGDPVEEALAEVAAADQAMDALAERLVVARRAAADAFAAAVADELRTVGIGEGEFVAELGVRELGPTGGDEVRFLVRPNPGLPFGPVAEIASGGELSRIALAIAAVAGGETMVFDEIDAGVGGVTAHKVADVLERLARRSQVLVITHLPQIASRADEHWSVTKLPGDPTRTEVRRLGEDERRAELERMLGGQEFLTAVAAT